MTGNAKRGAVKFIAILATGTFYGVCFAVAHPDPWRAFLWTVAAGVCIRLLWPSQDEGDALIKMGQGEE